MFKVNRLNTVFAAIIAIGLLVFPVLNKCPTEDARACTWHAEMQGNGTGTSFVDYYGITIYLP